MKDLVSIITPTYNSERFIAETIQSVLSQTYQNWEMIIVDDCSDDNTVQIVKSFCDERIKLYQNDKNSGAAISRNLAISKAKGKYIAFLDGDDKWYPNKLEHQISFMQKNGYDFTYTNYSLMDENSNELGVIVTGPKKINRFLMRCYNWIGCLTAVYYAEKIGYIQIPDIRKRNDWLIWLNVIESSNCVLLNEDLAFYRKRQGSISRTNKVKMVQFHFKIYNQMIGLGKVKGLIFTIINLVSGAFKKSFYHRKKG